MNLLCETLKVSKIVFFAIFLICNCTSIAFADEVPVIVTGKNYSYSTNCAEEDNVNIGFIGGASSITIKALHPANYGIETYSCDAIWDDCEISDETDYSFENPITDKNLYDNGTYYLLATREDTWWRPVGMEVWINNILLENNIHNIEIGEKTEDANEWPIYFVLYSDGNIRLIPHPIQIGRPQCFGSSVLIGSSVISNRPVADIQKIHFLSELKKIEVYYHNGDQFDINLDTINRSEAIIKVDIIRRINTKNPFIFFRSMFVAKDNADVEYVGYGNNNEELIASDILSFTNAQSEQWFFYRRTKSRHNQSAPDFEFDFFQENLESPQSFLILTDNSVPFTLPAGSYVQVHGSNAINTINIQSGAQVECLNFSGPNQINIEEGSSQFVIHRSGATVCLSTMAGTRIELPATLTNQTLRFQNGSLNLGISEGNVMIGDQVVDKTDTAIEATVDVNSTSINLF